LEAAHLGGIGDNPEGIPGFQGLLGLGGTVDEEAHEVRVHQLCLPHSV